MEEREEGGEGGRREGGERERGREGVRMEEDGGHTHIVSQPVVPEC